MAVEAFFPTTAAVPRRSLTLPLVGLAVLLTALAIVSIAVLSAARAYVGGESQWSRSQKSASHHLMRYADRREEADWTRYTQAIAVPLGDHRARVELDKPAPDLDIVRDGFVAGMNHPDDVPGMIRLYRWFGGVPFMARAIGAWADGDALIAQLVATADLLRQAVQANADAATLAPLRERVYEIDSQLTPLEQRFSATLGESARLTHGLLVGTVLLGAATLVAFSVLLMRRAARREQQQTQALRDSEARFQRAMVGSSDGFWEWDLTRDLAYFSPRFETLLGYNPGEMPTSAAGVRALLHPDDVAAGHAVMQGHLKRGEPYDVVLRLRGADGQFRWMRSRAQAQRGPGADDVRLAGSIVDITERRQAEQALRRSETLFRSLWETTSDAVLILGADQLIRFANPAAHDLFGYARGSLLGQPLARLQPAPAQAAHQAGMARYLRTGKRSLDWNGTEVSAVHADGRELPMEIRFAEFELGGEHHFVGFLRDIGQRKRAEREIVEARDRLEQRVAERTRALSEANERLRELDRLKSQFLATMSHELRTPLNSILGFAAVLERELPGPLNAEQRRQIGFIGGSGKHLLALINDLLDLSRIESGRMGVAREAFDFIDVAAEVVEQLRPLANQKGLALQLALPARLAMLGDRRKVYQVLLNLVGNALKFTPQGKVAVQADGVGDQLRVQVIDTGIGIAADDIGTLFEAFRQVDGSLERNHDGAGLGLHLCRKLLGLMGGTIDVRSTPGQGSCFSFALPIELPSAAAVEEAAVP